MENKIFIYISVLFIQEFQKTNTFVMMIKITSNWEANIKIQI